MTYRKNLNRRNFLQAGTFATGAVCVGIIASNPIFSPAFAKPQAVPFEISHTIEEWKKILSPEQFAILREEATEVEFSSPLNKEERRGLFYCADCDLPAYTSETKFNSGTGWPSFWDSLPNAVGTKQDNGFFSTRTEVHCRRCGGHFGHIFDDGPVPTGKRHCLNGLALTFKPTA